MDQQLEQETVSPPDEQEAPALVCGLIGWL